jgi:Ca-activated chloride channel family protein
LAVAAGFAVAILAAAAEALHARRVVAAAPLAFGPGRVGFAPLAAVAGLLRVAALGFATWGFGTLLALQPMTYRSGEVKPSEFRHLLLVLDVSPSMRLEDAGPSGKQSRAHRAADLIASFFERVNAERYKTTVVAVYTGAKPVVLDTADREVIRNILTDLPLSQAFKSGETDMFAGLEEAAKIAKPWAPGTAVLLCVTDGDTVPANGMPKMPVSVGNNVVIVGVGNPSVGRSIAGHSSRQDVSTLRQGATRLHGVYHDGNDKQMSTALGSKIDENATPPDKKKWGTREWARLAVGAGTGTFAGLPFLLSLVGTGWTPGRHPRAARREMAPTGGRR